MKKIIFVMFVLVIIGLVVQIASASEIMMPSPNYWNQEPGQNNMRYSVLFDGEGEAEVLAKIEIWNTDKNDVENLIVEIQGGVRIINVIQEHQSTEKKCSRWGKNYDSKS